MRAKIPTMLLVFTFVGFLSGFLMRAYTSELPRYEYASVVTSVISEKEEPSPVKLLFVGDVMLDRGIKNVVHKYGLGDYSFIFQNAELPEHDLLFGNFEGSMSVQGTNIGSAYSFRVDPVATSALSSFGFSGFSLANNHITDWGRVAANDTRMHLESAGIKTSGWAKAETEDTLAVFEVNETKVGFLSFSQFGPASMSAGTSTPGVLLIESSYYASLIANAKKEVDFLVVSLHFGEEYEREPSERDKKVARAAIDAGADLVVGHHPHVVRSIEQYNNGLIAYSLGNFVFDQYFSKDTMEGGLLLVVIDRDKNTRSFTTGTSTQNVLFQISSITMHDDSTSF